ncbi:MAG: ribosome maturation factor RimP [Rhodospirillales bacterium]|nr:ribosome maturation factor RimP [Rhodospirillales bacterium]MCB9973535.1 ribosome maturation factor RimP [Rhodospirillales bacterium]
MRLSPLEERIADIVTPVLEDMGYALVQAKMTSAEKRNILQILAENPETHNLGVDECAKLSRAVSAVLDVEDPIAGAYDLELSSPGIDRPLTRPEDFQIWQGFEAKIELDIPTDNGQKKFRGFLKGLSPEGEISLETDQGMVAFSVNSVHKAKLVLTDALIEKSKQMQTTYQNKDVKE